MPRIEHSTVPRHKEEHEGKHVFWCFLETGPHHNVILAFDFRPSGVLDKKVVPHLHILVFGRANVLYREEACLRHAIDLFPTPWYTHLEQLVTTVNHGGAPYIEGVLLIGIDDKHISGD